MLTLLALASFVFGASDPAEALVGLDRALGGEPVATSPQAPGSPPPALPLRTLLLQIPRLWDQGDYVAAAELLQRAEPDALLDPVAKMLTAESLAYAGRLEVARPLFAELAASPDPAMASLARSRLAEVVLSLGDSQQAAGLLKAQLHRADSAVLEQDLGRALGQTPEGVAALRRSFLLDPEGDIGAEAQRLLLQAPASFAGLSAREVVGYAQRLLRTGHAEEALAALKSGGAGQHTGEAEVCAAQCERALGHLDAARAHFQRALKLPDPRAAALARIALARADEADGAVTQALALLEQAAKLRPSSPESSEALYLAAWMAMDHGETAEADRLFAELANRRGDKHAGEAHWWTGWADELVGKPADALESWKPLLSPLAPGILGPQVLYWSARAFDELGQRADAQKLRRTLRDAFPTSYYALLERRGQPPSIPLPALLAACQGQGLEEGSALSQSLRRGELLWALGLLGLARAELDVADQLARTPAQALAVAEAEAALGEPGRAFTLTQLRGGRCFQGVLLTPEFFPRPFRAEVERAAEATQIDPVWIWAIMRQESRFEPRARSQALAGGAMQLLEATSSRVARIAGVGQLHRERPADAIEAAAWYLRALSDRFGGELALVAAAYNAGPTLVASWLATQGQRRLDVFVEQIPFRETRHYVKAVLANAAAYRALFGPADPLLDPTAPPPAPGAGISF